MSLTKEVAGLTEAKECFETEYAFQQYRGTLEEKEKLIASLHQKVELLKSSVIKKEGQ